MKRPLSLLFPCVLAIWMAGCGTGGSGSSPAPTPPGPPGTAASPASIAAGVAFLPQSFTSSYQYRTSLSHSGNSLYFSDSSSFPLKTLSLTDFSVTSLARKIGTPESVTVQGLYAYWVDEDRLNQTALSGATTTVLATGTRTPAAGATADIVVDNTHAYWVNTAGSTWTIQKVPLAGVAATTLATASRQIVSLKADANNIYWEENSPEPVTAGCGCGSAIRSVPKAGGTAVTLVDGTLNGLLPPPPVGQIAGSWIATGGLAVNGSTIYFGMSGSGSYSIMSIPAAGGAITTLATPGTPMSAATGSVLNIHSDGVNVYWIDAGNATLDSVAVAGGTPAILASGLQSPSALAINATNAYWAERGASAGCCLQMGGGVIKAVPLGGGTVSTVMGNLDAPTALALDAGNIYWNEIWRVASAPLAGGAATTLASGISSAMPRIAVDTVNAYILDGDLIKMVPLAGGTVQKLSPAHGGNIGDLSVINQDIATDGTNVYWSVSGPASPAIRSVPVGGGTAVTLSNPGTIVSPQDCYWRIALDAVNVYWSAGSASQAIGCTINKVPKAGGATTVLADVPYMRDFTVDGTDVYFSAFNIFGSISRISVNGGPAAILVSGTTLTPWVLANDSLNVYWIDPKQALPAGIGRMPKSGAGTSFVVEKVLATDTLLAADALAVDQNGIYWSENVGGRIYTPIVASTSSFPLLNATKALAASGESLTFAVSGSCTGSGSASSTAATTPSVFEGVAGFSSAVTSTVSLTNCTPATSTSSEIDYYDANYIPLGYDATASGGSYAVFLAPPSVPASVVVGNSGAIGTRALYTSSSKAVASGSEVLSYAVEPDTATSAIVNVTTKTYSAANALTLTTQVRYRITAAGSLKRLSEDHQDVATHLVLTFN